MHKSIHRASSVQFSIYGNSFGVQFNGLLAELPTILDSFLSVSQVIT